MVVAAPQGWGERLQNMLQVGWTGTVPCERGVQPSLRGNAGMTVAAGKCLDLFPTICSER